MYHGDVASAGEHRAQAIVARMWRDRATCTKTRLPRTAGSTERQRGRARSPKAMRPKITAPLQHQSGYVEHRRIGCKKFPKRGNFFPTPRAVPRAAAGAQKKKSRRGCRRLEDSRTLSATYPTSWLACLSLAALPRPPCRCGARSCRRAAKPGAAG